MFEKRKRSLAIVLAACMILAGCGSSGGTDSGAAESKEAEETKVSAVDMPTLEEQVLFEKDGIKITATGMEFEEANEYMSAIATVEVLFENEGTKDYAIVYNGIAVNGYMQDGFESISLPAGKKAKSQIRISEDDLQETGSSLENLGEITTEFMVYHDDSSVAFSTGLVSAKTSEAENVEVKEVDGGTEIYNANGITIDFLEIAELDESMIGAKIFINNTSDKNVVVSMYGATVNGSADVNTYNTPVVYAGAMAIGNIGFFMTNLEEAGIETIEKIENLTVDIGDLETNAMIGEPAQISFETK